MPPRAEVIGDPIAHSKSPAIHSFWLAALAIDGSYRAVRVRKDELADYFAARREDPDWRGCSVTAPLKQAVMPFLAHTSDAAQAIGAVNCTLPRDDALIGLNTDVDGIADALAGVKLTGRKVAIVGGGGAARAAIHHCVEQGAAEIGILVRDPRKATPLVALGPLGVLKIRPMAEAEAAIAGAGAIINASPLGMAHAPSVPGSLLVTLEGADPGATVLDMVYDPIETPLLRAARTTGLGAVDGLVMLVGQARKAFELFFGLAPPPERDSALRDLLMRSGQA